MTLLIDITIWAREWWGWFEPLALQGTLFGLFIWGAGRLLRYYPAWWLKVLYIIGFIRLLVPLPELGGEWPLIPDTLSAPPVAASVQQVYHHLLSPDLSFYFFLVWIGGMLVMLIGTVRAQIRLRNMFRAARPVTLSGEDSAGINLPARVRCYLANDQHGPLLSGLWRPRLLLPGQWARLGKEQKRLILAHELKHLRGADPLWLMLARVARIVHFYNPLVHILEKQFIDNMEKSCDDATLRQLNMNRKTYGTSLLDIASTAVPGLALPFSHTHNKLKKRILYHLNRKEQSMRIPLVIVVSATLMALLFTASCSQEKDYVDFFNLDQKPALEKKVAPRYPASAKEAGITGRVVLKVYINEDGKVDKAEVLKSVNEDLDEAAMEAASGLTFSPGIKNGEKVPCIMAVPYDFRLKQ